MEAVRRCFIPLAAMAWAVAGCTGASEDDAVVGGHCATDADCAYLASLAEPCEVARCVLDRCVLAPVPEGTPCGGDDLEPEAVEVVEGDVDGEPGGGDEAAGDAPPADAGTDAPPGCMPQAAGRVVWEAEVHFCDCDQQHPAATPDGGVVGHESCGKLVKLDAKGAKAWTYDSGNCGGSASDPVVSSDGVVYVGTGDGRLLALDGAAGTVKWSVQPGAPERRTWSPAIGPDGNVYVGVENCKLVSVSPGGKVLWTWTHPNAGSSVVCTFSRPDFNPSTKHLYIGLGGKLEAFDRTTGTQLWEKKPNQTNITLAPAFLSVGGKSYVVYKPCDYYSYDASSGQQVKTLDAECDTFANPARGPVRHDKGGGFVAVGDAALLRPDLSYVYQSPVGATSSNPVVDAAGVTYVATSKAVVAIGPTGGVLWEEPAANVKSLALSTDQSSLFVFGNRVSLFSLAAKCTACERFCDGDRVMQCGPDGIASEPVTDCKAPETCRKGACEPFCGKGIRECKDSDTVVECAADGGAWNVVETCQSGYSCEGWKCVKDPEPTCSLSQCSKEGFSYSCGSGSSSTSYSYCSNGNVSVASIKYSNGHTVTCTYNCSGWGGSCKDDTGAKCSF